MIDVVLSQKLSEWHRSGKVCAEMEREIRMMNQHLGSYGYLFNNIQDIYNSLRSKHIEFNQINNARNSAQKELVAFQPQLQELGESWENIPEELRTKIDTLTVQATNWSLGVLLLHKERFSPYMSQIQELLDYCVELKDDYHSQFLIIQKSYALSLKECKKVHDYHTRFKDDPGADLALGEANKGLLKGCLDLITHFKQIKYEGDNNDPCDERKTHNLLNKILPSFKLKLENLNDNMAAFEAKVEEAGEAKVEEAEYDMRLVGDL